MNLVYIVSSLLAFFISLLGIKLSLKYFPRWGIMDRQESHSIHKKAVIRGGGLAIFLAFIFTVMIVLPEWKPFLGMMLGATLIVGVNFIDDIRSLPWYLRLGVEFVAAILVIWFGVDIDIITSPFGGIIDLSWGAFTVAGFEISPLADGFAIIWIVGLMNVFNWLDGLNGLAGGVGAIASLVLFSLSLLPFIHQPEMAIIAIILFGAIMGFFPFNFFKGQIKLGDTGSKFLGFMFAVTAILNKGKLATFGLVLGLPLIDFAWVIFRRMFIDQVSIFRGDQGHFHHRMLKAGFTQKQTVVVLWTISAIFGVLALVLRNAQQKLIGLLIMFLVLVGFAIWVVKRGQGESKTKN